MFERFGDYMFSLLTASLRQVKKAANQFYIFFSTVGGLFDDCKQKIFALREASMVVSAPDALLSLHGEERGLARLRGETLDNYRLRLELHGQVSEAAGTNEGIRYLAKSFGYDNVEITPDPDPSRWAEATVLFIGGRVVLDDREILLQELGRIKPARTLLHLSKEQRYEARIWAGSAYLIGKEITIRQG